MSETATRLADELQRTASAERRRAWRDRNRLAVVDALLDLFAEGNLRPDAQEIAERSGVSRRSVFRYFDDMEDLDRMAIVRCEERVRPLIGIPEIGEGTLPERIESMVRQRQRLYEAIAPMARVARLRAPFHPLIHERLEAARRYYARQVEQHFARELSRLEGPDSAEQLMAAQAVCSFEAFDYLAGRDVAPEVYGRVLRRSLVALFCARMDSGVSNS